ncbi:unnamed protein product [Penicillium viridicatum]
MVSTKTILFICLSSLAAADTFWACANTQGKFRVSQNNAEWAIKKAPLSDGKTKTSYPHWFTNGYDGNGNVKDPKKSPPIKFPGKICNKPPKHSSEGSGKDDNYLLEFPLKSNEELYPYDKKPKEPTEPARVIYVYPHRVFCGIVAHTKGNEGPLELCEPADAKSAEYFPPLQVQNP